jgi:capsular exopolysaccharide synthesis family protein
MRSLTVTLRDYLRAIRASWPVVILCLALGISCSALVTALLPREYQADVMVYISAQVTPTETAAALDSGELAKQRMSSYQELATSPKVAEDVVQKLGLGVTPEELSKRLSARATTDTVVMTISALDANPDSSAVIANSVADSFARLVDQLERPPNSPQSALLTARIVRPATPAVAPNGPNLPLNLALGALLGLLVGIGTAFLRRALDVSVRSQGTLRQALGVPTIGLLTRRKGMSRTPLTIHQDPRAPQAEEFRQLRTTLRFNNSYRRNKLFVVSSSQPGEGKTTTACNLAVALADSGSRVLLIEADFRHPKAADYLGLDREKGLTDILSGEARLDDVIQRWGENAIHFLPCGPLPNDPSELLGSRNMAALLAEAHRRYDFVLVDTPPLLPYPDASAVAPYTDGVILVVRYGRTKLQHVQAAARSLDAVSARLLGTVMTMLPRRGPDRFESDDAHSRMGVQDRLVSGFVPELPEHHDVELPGHGQGASRPSPRPRMGNNVVRNGNATNSLV